MVLGHETVARSTNCVHLEFNIAGKSHAWDYHVRPNGPARVIGGRVIAPKLLLFPIPAIGHRTLGSVDLSVDLARSVVLLY